MVQFSTHPISLGVKSGLPRQHRAWVALYSLQNSSADRNTVLLQNNVTETDLLEHLASWHRLRHDRPLLKR